MKPPAFERQEYVSVIATSAEQARAFFGFDASVRAFDVGPPHDAHKWKPDARVWHLYPQKPKLRIVRQER